MNEVASTIHAVIKIAILLRLASFLVIRLLLECECILWASVCVNEVCAYLELLVHRANAILYKRV